MRVLFIITGLVAVGWTASISVEEVEFQAWKQKFRKIYSSEEEESQRKMTWLANHKLVQEHNMLADQGIKSYRLGMKYFADMDNQEYRQVVLNNLLSSFNRTRTQPAGTLFRQKWGAALPENVDWRKEGYVTGVKQQFQCEACWAFSATGALEGQMYRKTGKLVPLSEQQLVDCSWLSGNKGCAGGLIDQAYEYIVSSGGLVTESSYQYEGKEGVCRFKPLNFTATCKGYEDLPIGNEDILQEAVASVGPISAAVDASHYTFQHYRSGVYYEPYCSIKPNHAILIIGYGMEFGQEYWLVKNSWGPDWGDHGYVKVSRNRNNNCGIASVASYPLV